MLQRMNFLNITNLRRFALPVGIAVLVLALAGGGFYAWRVQRDAKLAAIVEQYDNATFGLSFTYSGTYELQERNESRTGERLHHSITLVRKSDLPLPKNGEGPTTITIDIHQNNVDHQSTELWIRNDSRSNFKLGDGELLQTTIGGQQALSYRWSGLYEGMTVAVARDTWIYAFSVTYMDINDPIVADFAALRNTVSLTRQ